MEQFLKSLAFMIEQDFIDRARNNPASLLPKCRSPACEMPVGCCNSGIGVNAAMHYMIKAGLTKDEMKNAFIKAYGEKGGKFLADAYLNLTR